MSISGRLFVPGRRSDEPRRARKRRDLALFVCAPLVCLAVAAELPGKLETLSHTKLVLVPAASILLIGIGWLAVVRPFAAFVLAVALIGIVRIEPAPVDAVFAVLMVASIVLRHVRPRVPGFVAVPLIVFALLSLLSMTNVVDFHRAITFEGITLYLLGLGVWLSWVFTDARWVSAGCKTYIIVSAVSAAVGVLALYVPFPGAHLFVYQHSRAEGLLKDPNVYSAFLVPAAVIVLEEVMSPRLLAWRRSVLVFLFVLISGGVVVAYSRAAWLNMALAISTLLIVQASRRGGLRRAMRGVALLVVSGIAGFAMLVVTGSLGFLEDRSHLQAYDTQRFSNQSSAFSRMTDHLFGYGPGQTDVLLPLSAHSTFVRAAFEEGLLGLVSITLVLGGTLVAAWLLARRRVDVHGVGTAALLGIWLGQVVNSFFIDTLHWRHLWFLAGLIWCGYAMGAQRKQPSLPARR